MNLYCESCNGTCYCKEFEAEQEAIERLQAMPVEEAVLKLWPTESVETTAKVLEIEPEQVRDILGVDS